jgi:putative transposase
VRRIIYTTNAIEALDSKLRRVGVAAKLLYLVLNHAAAEWKRPPREWAEAIHRHLQRAFRKPHDG